MNSLKQGIAFSIVLSLSAHVIEPAWSLSSLNIFAAKPASSFFARNKTAVVGAICFGVGLLFSNYFYKAGLQEAKRALKNKAKKLNGLKGQKEKLETQVKDLTRQKDQAFTRLLERSAQAESELPSKDLELEKLQKTIAAQETEIHRLRVQCTANKNHAANKEIKVTALQAQVHRLDETNTGLLNELLQDQKETKEAKKQKKKTAALNRFKRNYQARLTKFYYPPVVNLAS